jgi:hypothetical protein
MNFGQDDSGIACRTQVMPQRAQKGL